MDEDKPIDPPEAEGQTIEEEEDADVFEPDLDESGRPCEALIEVSMDGLRATTQIFPPVGEAGHVTMEILKKALSDKKISHGVHHDVLQKIVDERLYMKTIEIAKGTPAVSGDDARLILHYNKNRRTQDRSLDNLDRVNLKELDKTINVDSDDLLIEKKPATPGQHGTTVHGRTIPQRRGKDIRLRVGKGVKVDDSGLLFHSIIPGQVIFRNNQIRVEDVYEIEDVDASTGNIHFKGSVIIKGLVNDGYLIESNSDIRITGSIGAARLYADGDILIAGGIFGGGNCEVVSHNGSIFVKFAHNAKLSAGENIFIEDYAKACNLTAGKAVKLTSNRSDHGFLQGGRTIAAEEVFAQSIGSPLEQKTFVGVGVDSETAEAVAEDENWIADTQKNFAEALKNLRYLRQIQEAGKLDPRKEELLDKIIIEFSKIRESIHPRFSGYHKSIRTMIGANRGKITAMENIFPGVQLKIGGESITIDKVVKAVTYILGNEGVISRAVRADDGSVNDAD